MPDVVALTLQAGAPAVLLREKDLSRDERLALGEQLRAMTAEAGALLLVASDVGLAQRLGADGVHLAASDPPVPSDVGLVGRSCHDDVEVARARAEGTSYVTVSPVAETASKPEYGPPLGTSALRTCVAAAEGVPVLALGGVTPANAATWRAAGASGVAVMGGVMGAARPDEVVRALLAAWSSAARVTAGPVTDEDDGDESGDEFGGAERG